LWIALAWLQIRVFLVIVEIVDDGAFVLLG